MSVYHTTNYKPINAINNYKPITAIISTKSFRQKFYDHYPFMKKLEMSNMLIAGGSVVKTLFNPPPNRYKTDIDIFIYGLTKCEANSKVERFINEFTRLLDDYVYNLHSLVKSKYLMISVNSFDL